MRRTSVAELVDILGVNQENVITAISKLDIDLTNRSPRTLDSNEVMKLAKEIKPFQVISTLKKDDPFSVEEAEELFREAGAIRMPDGSLFLGFESDEEAQNTLVNLASQSSEKYWSLMGPASI